MNAAISCSLQTFRHVRGNLGIAIGHLVDVAHAGIGVLGDLRPFAAELEQGWNFSTHEKIMDGLILFVKQRLAEISSCPLANIRRK